MVQSHLVWFITRKHSRGSLPVYHWLGAITQYSAGMASSSSGCLRRILVCLPGCRECACFSVRDERRQALCKDVRNVVGYTMLYHCTGVAECRMTCPSFTARTRQVYRWVGAITQYSAGMTLSRSRVPTWIPMTSACFSGQDEQYNVLKPGIVEWY